MSAPLRFAGEDLLAYGLIAVPLVGLTAASGYHPFLIPILLALLLHPLLDRLGKRVELNLGIVGYSVATLPVALLFQTVEVRGAGGQQFHNAFYFGLGSLLFALLRLYGPRAPGRLGWIVLFSSTALAAVGLGLPSYLATTGTAWRDRFPGGYAPHPTTFYVGLIVTYGGLVLLGCRGSMWVRRREDGPSRGARVGVALAFLLTAGLSVVIARVVAVYYDDLNMLYLRLLQTTALRSTGGFSGEARLGTVIALQQGAESRRVALRAYTDRAPGYLRGKTFLYYEGGAWSSQRPGRPTTSARQPDHGRYQLEGRPPPAPGAEPRMRIETASHVSAHYFLPADATALNVPSQHLLLGPGNSLRSGDEPTTSGYDVFTDPTVPVEREADEEAYRDVPLENTELVAALDHRLAELELSGPVPVSPAQAVATLQRWFNAHYTYKFGITFDRKRDPVAQFLEEKHHGHCELFASAGVLLLRRAGVRARYVTGFVCEEKNPYADVYLARDEAAHAWTEYYDPGRGWLLAEFTPPGGQPHVTPPTTSEALWEWLRSGWDRVASVFRGGLSQLPGRLVSALRDLVLWVAAAWYRMGVLFAFVLAYVLRNAIRRRAVRRAELTYADRFAPDFAALRERYLALERRLEEAGRGRAPAETPLEWAQRLEQAELPPEEDRAAALALIREFASARYGAEARPPAERLSQV